MKLTKEIIKRLDWPQGATHLRVVCAHNKWAIATRENAPVDFDGLDGDLQFGVYTRDGKKDSEFRPIAGKVVLPDAAKPDAAKPDAVKPVAAKPDAAKPVAAKPVAVKPVAAKPDAVKPVAAKPDAAKPVAVKPDAVKPVAAKPDAAKPVAVKPVAVKPDAAKPVAVKPVAVKPVDEFAQYVAEGWANGGKTTRQIAEEWSVRHAGAEVSRLDFRARAMVQRLRRECPNGGFVCKAPSKGGKTAKIREAFEAFSAVCVQKGEPTFVALKCLLG